MTTRPVDKSGPRSLAHLLAQDHDHVTVAGDPVTIAAGAQATSAVVLGGASDAAGGIRAVSIGSANAAGAIATITFAVPYAATPKSVQLSCRNLAAAGIHLYVSALSTTAMTVSAAIAPAATTTYDFNYLVVA
jgi:hypothetical protein